MSIPLKNIKELSERLKYIRQIKGLSQVQLAEMAGATQQAIQQAESGQARRPRYLNELAQALEIPPEWLTMNKMPTQEKIKGLSEKDAEMMQGFKTMPKGEQKFIRDYIKSKSKKK